MLQATEPVTDWNFDEWSRELLPSLELALASLAVFLAVFLLGWYLLVPALVRIVRRRNERNPTVVEAIGRYTRLVVFVVAAAVGVAAAGYGDLLAGSGLVIAAGTLAIGVAGQEVLGNLVSGLFLVSDPEFNVDDWIEWEDGAGVVEAIRFRVTRVRTADGEVITVPNTTLATNPVWRPYSRDRFQVDAAVGVAHDEDVQRAIEVVREAMDVVDRRPVEQEPRVIVEEIGEDALWLRAEFWIADPSRSDVREARSTFVRHLHERLRAEEIEFSPPSDHALTGELDVR